MRTRMSGRVAGRLDWWSVIGRQAPTPGPGSSRPLGAPAPALPLSSRPAHCRRSVRLRAQRVRGRPCGVDAGPPAGPPGRAGPTTRSNPPRAGEAVRPSPSHRLRPGACATFPPTSRHPDRDRRRSARSAPPGARSRRADCASTSGAQPGRLNHSLAERVVKTPSATSMSGARASSRTAVPDGAAADGLSRQAQVDGAARVRVQIGDLDGDIAAVGVLDARQQGRSTVAPWAIGRHRSVGQMPQRAWARQVAGDAAEPTMARRQRTPERDRRIPEPHARPRRAREAPGRRPPTGALRRRHGPRWGCWPGRSGRAGAGRPGRSSSLRPRRCGPPRGPPGAAETRTGRWRCGSALECSPVFLRHRDRRPEPSRSPASSRPMLLTTRPRRPFLSSGALRGDPAGGGSRETRAPAQGEGALPLSLCTSSKATGDKTAAFSR